MYSQLELQTAVMYICPGQERFLALDNEPSGLVFEKELIYTGNFIKDDKKNPPQRFGVDLGVIHHWDSTIKQMLSNGIDIPVPLEHTTDPLKRRGSLIGSRAGINKSGLPALYGKFSFRDQDSANLAKTADVSIFVTDDYTDGRGNSYKRPIRHVALTDYPVIPALEKFQPLAASLIPFDFEGLNMAASPALLALAQQLGIQGAESMEDQQIIQSIVSMVRPQQPQMKPPMAPQGPPNHGAPTPPTGPQLPRQLMMSLTNTFKESRVQKLNSLVDNFHISKATRDDLEKDWCSEDSLALSITEDSATVANESAFDNLVNALKKNKAMNGKEQTGKQVVGLSNPAMGSQQQSSLEANAEKRAAEAAKA
jgi:hypothetical protein